MSDHYDTLETRSADQRAADLARDLPAQIERAQGATGYAGSLGGVAAGQKANPPFGGFTLKAPSEHAHIFQSPGPIYEPGERATLFRTVFLIT